MNKKDMISMMKKIISVVLMVLLSSCSLMKDDRSDCPDCRNPLRITLRYDYNTMRANMFADHVEEATIYVVDPETKGQEPTWTREESSREGEDYLRH